MEQPLSEQAVQNGEKSPKGCPKRITTTDYEALNLSSYGAM